MMPKRRRTRAQNRADYMATERRHNRDARQARETQRVATQLTSYGPPPTEDDEPPPF
jgi:hypothetical protein